MERQKRFNAVHQGVYVDRFGEIAIKNGQFAVVSFRGKADDD
jgi:hypothetical protein